MISSELSTLIHNGDSGMDLIDCWAEDKPTDLNERKESQMCMVKQDVLEKNANPGSVNKH